VETTWQNEFEMTAAAHLSGPYSIGEVMRELILSDSVYFYPGYLPNTILSYQTVYGNLFGQLDEVFKQPYAAKIADFYAGNLSLSDLNDELINMLEANEGESRPLQMLQPDIVQEIIADPGHPFNLALKDNNVYAWAPETPTRIYYCMADDQVPFENSLLARDTMVARGAADLIANDVSPTSDHGGCVVPALTQTLFFFLVYQQIETYSSATEPDAQRLVLSPNPAGSSVQFENADERALLSIFTSEGRLCYEKRLAAGTQRIELQDWPEGVYFVQIQSAGSTRVGKLYIQH